MRGDIFIRHLPEGFRIDFRTESETRSASGSAGQNGLFRSASQATKFLISLGVEKKLASSSVAQAKPDSTIDSFELAHDDMEFCFPLISSDKDN